ncbi:MAG TPA: prepilin-type N-terminal cleavage/methylation domain-containing protein [Polyangia bacterium]|nr:prepilin-type N-terminal cleavage/methylation domain-containing protein [Polyangia bacterium]
MARGRNIRGFTLVELMIVVAIIAVLATIAGTAYRRYMDSGRTTEAMAMLGEIRAKEEAYRAEFNAYAGWSADSELAAKSLPAVDNTTCVGGTTKEPCWKTLPTDPSTSSAPWPVWAGLGINAGKRQLQCGYILNSGTGVGGAGTGYPTNTLGQGMIGATAFGQPWWYAVAICDNDGSTGTNATFTTASSTTVVSALNEHQ